MAWKILIVDDDSQTLMTTARLLRAEIKDSTESMATSISSAKAELTAEHFDLMIMDGTLQRHGDGADFAAELVKSGQRVLIFSGDDTNQRPGVPFLHRLNANKLVETIMGLLSK